MKRSWGDDDNIADKAVYSLITMLGLLVRSISRRKSTAIAHLLGDFVYKILKTRRPLVEKNLSYTFPQKTPAEINAVVRQVCRQQAAAAGDGAERPRKRLLHATVLTAAVKCRSLG